MTWPRAAAALVVGAASLAHAQRQPVDASRCDSIVAAARVDSVPVAVFLAVRRIDGAALPLAQAELIADYVRAAFVPPSPFRLTTFSGPARMRVLRPVMSDTTVDLRAPTVTGVYRFTATRQPGPIAPAIMRASLIPGFDSAAVVAIRGASGLRNVLVPPDDEDSMRVDVRISTDSSADARRMIAATFPRMPVIDAVPRRDNPPAAFPEDEKADSVTTGEVVLRFVVDRAGLPNMATIELVRATSLSFARAAIVALPSQRFQPATIHGCAVAQAIDYSFSFVLPHH
ncbi:MAG TPA: energy transducer TonB [Gemmatimonadaceae bacterium]